MGHDAGGSKEDMSHTVVFVDPLILVLMLLPSWMSKVNSFVSTPGILMDSVTGQEY